MSLLAMQDVIWLTGDGGRPFLERATNSGDSLAALVKSLRKDLSPPRAHLILEQAELRARARDKFGLADRMFFTRQSLQQASGEDIAHYIASRFPIGEPVADLCCGIGGNLLALAGRGPVTGVERDPVVGHFARCNVRVAGARLATVQVADVAGFSLEGCSALFIDPDRRSHGRRTVDVRYYQPDLPALDRLVAECPDAAVKLAPATAVPDHWRRRVELEWIGYARECKQQIAWFGELARHPGRRVATVCSRSDPNSRTVVENPGARANTTERFETFIYIPHPAVATARLVKSIAAEYSLDQIAGAEMLTGKDPVLDKALATFETVAECPFDVKKVSSLLAEQNIAPQVVRAMGHKQTAAKLKDRLPPDGGFSGGVFVEGRGSSRRVIVALRRT